MSDSHPSNLEVLRSYFSAIERRASPVEIAGYFHPDVIQEEFPNRFSPTGATRNLKALLEASTRGQNVVENEKYEILDAINEGVKIALEVRWTASLLIPVGTLKAGQTMNARFGVFFQIDSGKIKRQGNYDCFDPF